MVWKLQLKLIKHPNSYKFNYIKKGAEVMVYGLCTISFFIGKNFSCEVLCDVIEIDVCHLILRRPWQIDRRVWYNGRVKAYTLKYKNKKFCLLPSSPLKLVDSYDESKKSTFVIVSWSQWPTAFQIKDNLLDLMIAKQNQVHEQILEPI